jgi:hypothetical protein
MESNMLSDYFDPAAQDSALLPSEQQTLNEAKRLMANKKPGKAAPLFAKLAEVLASARQPQRAANLHAMSAQAFAESHNESPALTQARAALNLFLQYKMTDRVPVFYASIIRELTKRGLANAAETLTKEFASKVPQPASETNSIAARLPANCPQCGAPVHISDPHLTAASKVECIYCGTPIRPLA